jgi:DNA-directed RNA polymerase subunit H (RpoH/RPB5)
MRLFRDTLYDLSTYRFLPSYRLVVKKERKQIPMNAVYPYLLPTGVIAKYFDFREGDIIEVTQTSRIAGFVRRIKQVRRLD